MATNITNRVWDKSKATGTTKLLLFALADVADDDGFCWFKDETLAKKINNQCERSVKRKVAELEKLQEVFVIRGPGGRGNLTNKYVVTVGMPIVQLKSILQDRCKMKPLEADSSIVEWRKKGDRNPDRTVIVSKPSEVNPDRTVTVSETRNPDKTGQETVTKLARNYDRTVTERPLIHDTLTTRKENTHTAARCRHCGEGVCVYDNLVDHYQNDKTVRSPVALAKSAHEGQNAWADSEREKARSRIHASSDAGRLERERDTRRFIQETRDAINAGDPTYGEEERQADLRHKEQRAALQLVAPLDEWDDDEWIHTITESFDTAVGKK